jgi:hypothetical protein
VPVEWGDWRFLFAWWPTTEAGSNYPAVPGGQVPTLQTDGTVKWSTGTAGASDLIESGDVLYEDGSPLYE